MSLLNSTNCNDLLITLISDYLNTYFRVKLAGRPTILQDWTAPPLASDSDSARFANQIKYREKNY